MSEPQSPHQVTQEGPGIPPGATPANPTGLPAPAAGPPKPLVPPAPRQPKRRKRPGDYRWLVWPIAAVAGFALGVVAYRYVPAVVFYFDYWVALALS